MFTHTYETRYGDYKDFNTVKTGAILDMIQDVAIKDSERAGFGIHKLRDMNLAWLLQGINIEIIKPAKTGVPIDVSTGVKTLKGATSQRCCIVRQNDEVIAKTVANWFLFNTETSKISPVLPEMQSSYSFYDFDDESFNYKKLKTVDISNPSYKVKIFNHDIDTNMHLNNQKGAQILMDALPFDFKFKKANIIYKNPAYLGEIMDVFTEKTETGIYVHIANEASQICVAGLFEE